MPPDRRTGRGVFSSLRDTHTFMKAHVGQGAFAWPGEIDLAPRCDVRCYPSGRIARITANDNGGSVAVGPPIVDNFDPI